MKLCLATVQLCLVEFGDPPGGLLSQAPIVVQDSMNDGLAGLKHGGQLAHRNPSLHLDDLLDAVDEPLHPLRLLRVLLPLVLHVLAILDPP